MNLKDHLQNIPPKGISDDTIKLSSHVYSLASK